MWKPNVNQFTTPITLQTRVETNVNGAPEISYVGYDQAFCNWKSRGGTENSQSGSLVVYDTAELIMWYRPGLTECDRILLNGDTSLAYEIVNIENVEMRNQFMIIKVAKVVNA